MTQDDDETQVTIHYGDKIVTVQQRFDRIEKLLVIQGIGVILLVGIHLPEVGPILADIAKYLH